MADNIFTKLELYNSIPKPFIDALIEEVDILDGANEEFLKLVEELELMTDYKKRAEVAKKFIDTHSNYLKEILYTTLGSYLADLKSIDIAIWRKLYVLERSVPPRFGDKYTWVQRLKIFYNTFLHELNIHKSVFIFNNKKYKLYLKHGNEEHPTNHDKLVYGMGQGNADFYFYDDKMIDVEYKYSDEPTLKASIAKYSDGKYTYNAKWLIFFMSNIQKYYLVNPNGNITYNDLGEVESVEDIIIPLNLEAPQGLVKL